MKRRQGPNVAFLHPVQKHDSNHRLNTTWYVLRIPVRACPLRYETFWLNFMADELALCPGTLVVAHGTAADAVLRFTEKSEAST